MNNIAGPPVEGRDFFGREEAIHGLRELLDHHDILLLGPRRIGKTSIARQVMAAVRAEGWQAVEINVAACPDERGFLDKLSNILADELTTTTEKALNAVGGVLGAIRDRIKSVKISLPGAGSFDVTLGNAEAEDWTTVARDLLSLIGEARAHSDLYG
jgi:hypothetical protein